MFINEVTIFKKKNYYCEGAQRCTAYGESPCVFVELVFVGYKAWPLFLGLGALVSGTDDVPCVGVCGFLPVS
jgi:hypothetical protein